IMQADACTAHALVIECFVALDLTYARDRDLGRQAIIERTACLYMSRLILVLAGWQIVCVGVNQDVDVLGKAMDETMPFRERRSALEFKAEAQPLQAPEGVHDPIILLDQTRIDRLLA